MWRHQQVDGLLRQVGPDSAQLPFQVSVTQTLGKDPWEWGRTHKHVTSNLHHSDPSIHINVRAAGRAARPSGFCGFSLSPDASLISRAVRIRAISVEVKCTVLSSAIGMFIFTKRWEEWEAREEGPWTRNSPLAQGEEAQFKMESWVQSNDRSSDIWLWLTPILVHSQVYKAVINSVIIDQIICYLSFFNYLAFTLKNMANDVHHYR